MKQKQVSLIKWLLAAAVILAAMIILRPVHVLADNHVETLPLNSTWISGSIATSDDVYYYQFTLPSDGWVHLDIQDFGFQITEGYFTGVNVRVINNDWTNIDDSYYRWGHNSGTPTEPVTMSTPSEGLALQKGDYYLRVSHEVNGQTTPDTFRVRGSFTPVDNDDTGSNHTFADAQSLNAMNMLTGFLSASEPDDDFYVINVPAQTTIKIEYNAYIRASHIALWNGDMQLVKTIYPENEGSYSTPGSKTTEIGVSAGTYYIKVSKSYGYDNPVTRYGKYTLRWSYTSPFTDVSETSFFYDPVVWAMTNGITSGTSATAFSPNASCTRAQVITFLYRMAGSPSVTGNMVSRFTDIPSSAYYRNAVEWALENNIASGTSATKFSPSATCTRAQAVTFLYRYAGSPSVSVSNTFADVRSGDYFAGAVIWASKNEITSGTSATAFSPKGICTRAQVVTFLYRYANR